MTKLIDLTGKHFGAWTAISYAGCNHLGQPTWNCICACGIKRAVVGQTLRNGMSVSCGCTKSEAISKAHTTHGMARTPTYSTWMAMLRRTRGANIHGVLYYRMRQVNVCARWQESFENFLADMGEKPEGTSIDRINPEGNYEPGNCRWATPVEQSNNRRARRTQEQYEKALAEAKRLHEELKQFAPRKRRNQWQK